MLDEICGFILWSEALMNRKVLLAHTIDLETPNSQKLS